jgi:Subtilase family
MSLSSSGKTAAVTNAISYARSKGVVVVAAAGNERTNKSPTRYPAADVGVIAVAATDSNDKYGYFSNAGSYVDLAAPGVGILSTVPGGYASYNGTSMAAPHVAALAALLLAKKPGLTPDQVQQAMELTAVDLGSRGKDKDYGYGRIDAVAALGAVSDAVVTSTASSQRVLFGTRVDTAFTVAIGGAAAAKRAVQLCTADNGAAFNCRNATTSATGTVVLSRKVTYPYQVRLVVPTTSKSFSTGTSATYSYSAASEVTLAAGKRNTAVVSLVGAAKQTVELQQSADGQAWTTVRTFRAAARTTLTAVAAGFQYRVVVPDVPAVAGSVSNTVQM